MPSVWKWDKKKLDVLEAVFLGAQSHVKIMQKHAVSRGTFNSWLKHPEFVKALEEKRANLIEELSARGAKYVRKEQRLINLDRMARSAQAEYRKRPWLEERRQIGIDPDSGEPMYQTNEHFNRDAHAAFRDSLADIAAELGARKNVTELSGEVAVTERITFYMPEPEPDPRAKHSDREQAEQAEEPE